MSHEPTRECPPAETLYAYIDGVLGRAAAERWRRHVEACPECSVAIGEAESLRQFGQSIGAKPPNEEDLASVDRWTTRILHEVSASEDDAEPVRKQRRHDIGR